MRKVVIESNYDQFTHKINALVNEGYDLVSIGKQMRWVSRWFGGWWVMFHTAILQKTVTLRANFGPVREQSFNPGPCNNGG